jgi:hypothetical protein
MNYIILDNYEDNEVGRGKYWYMIEGKSFKDAVMNALKKDTFYFHIMENEDGEEINDIEKLCEYIIYLYQDKFEAKIYKEGKLFEFDE